MSDYELDEIRRIRHEISAEHGHDLRKLAEYCRGVEKRLRESGRYRFADEQGREVKTANSESSEHAE